MRKLFEIINCIFIVILTIVTLGGLLLNANVQFSYLPIIVILGVLINILLLFLINKYLVPKICNFKWIPILLCILYLICCVFLGQKLKLGKSWDMGAVFELAKCYANGEPIESNHLYLFPNNGGIVMFYTTIFKFFKMFGIKDYLAGVTVFNSVLIGLTPILIYNIARDLYGNKSGLMVLIIYVFTPAIMLYSPIYYSDSLALFFTLLMVCCYIKIDVYCKNEKLKYLFYALLGILAGISIKLKITTSFIIIAYVVYLIFNKKIGKKLKYLFICVILMAITILASNMYINAKFIPDKEKLDITKIPIQNWILMGLRGNGGYDYDCYDFAYKFRTYHEKQNAESEKIKETWNNYDFKSFTMHIMSKLFYTWDDGTYFTPEQLRRNPVNDTILHEIVVVDGKYSNFYKYIPQIQHLTSLLLTLIGALEITMKNKFKNTNEIFYILIFGFMIFFLIWETRSRYILPTIPFLIISEIKGLEVAEKIKNKETKINIKEL